MRALDDSETALGTVTLRGVQAPLATATKKATNIIIIGEDEYKNNFYTVKKLATGQQIKVNLDSIKDTLND